MPGRLLRATAIAPLIVPLLYCAGSLAAAFADPVRRPSAGQNLVSGVMLVFAFGAPVAYAATLCAGLPLLWVLRRLGPLTLWRSVAVGLGVGYGTALALAPHLGRDLIRIPLPPWSGAVMGAAAAAVWWKLANARELLTARRRDR